MVNNSSDLKKTELIFVSTIHYDPKGRIRLLSILEEIRPDIITVEANDEMEKYLQSERSKSVIDNVRRILERRGANLDQLVKFDEFQVITLNTFEAPVVREYCGNRIPYHLIDLWDDIERDGFENLQISTANEFPIGNLSFLTTSLQEGADFEYKGVRVGYKTGVTVPIDDPEVGRRDSYMGSRLQKLIEQHPGKRIVHVGGTKHSFDDPDKRTLYSKFKDSNPTRYLLIDVEK